MSLHTAKRVSTVRADVYADTAICAAPGVQSWSLGGSSGCCGRVDDEEVGAPKPGQSAQQTGRVVRMFSEHLDLLLATWQPSRALLDSSFYLLELIPARPRSDEALQALEGRGAEG